MQQYGFSDLNIRIQKAFFTHRVNEVNRKLTVLQFRNRVGGNQGSQDVNFSVK